MPEHAVIWTTPGLERACLLYHSRCEQSFLETVGGSFPGLSSNCSRILRRLDSSQSHCLSVSLVPHPIPLTPKYLFFQKVDKCSRCQRFLVTLQSYMPVLKPVEHEVAGSWWNCLEEIKFQLDGFELGHLQHILCTSCTVPQTLWQCL